MKKCEDGRIGFNSTLEHRTVERARYHLKKSGIEYIETIYHDKFTWIMNGIYENKKLRIYILIREIDSDKVAMNRAYYELERSLYDNPLLVLSDRRHMYIVKFLFFNDINSREYSLGKTPIVLLPERDFKDMSRLKTDLDIMV